jgi:hypothetical protein
MNFAERALVCIGTETLLASSWVFSLKQKDALRERDGNKCQAPFRHNCNWKKASHAHHLLPQGYCEKFGIDPDFSTNGIYICENAHLAVIHPDAKEAKIAYAQGDKEAFDKMKKVRHDKLEERVPYWNTEQDRALYAIAVRNTQRAERKGWRWPLNGRQKVDASDSYKP